MLMVSDMLLVQMWAQTYYLSRSNEMERFYRLRRIFFWVLGVYCATYIVVHLIMEILSVLPVADNLQNSFDIFFGMAFGVSLMIVCFCCVVFGARVHLLLRSLPTRSRRRVSLVRVVRSLCILLSCVTWEFCEAL